MIFLWLLMTFWAGFLCGQWYTNRLFRRATKLFDNTPHVQELDLIPLILKPDRWTASEWQEFKTRDDRQKNDIQQEPPQ
jgi:hypothetical protein